MNPIEEAVRRARHPVALTGAGISAPSGIPTFQGLWKGRPIRDFLSRAYFHAHRLEFFELFLAMVAWCDKRPNAAHWALAKMGLPIITQNIDGLHHKARSQTVHELHGNLAFVRCPRCAFRQAATELAAALAPLYAAGDWPAVEKALTCACGAALDTDVVLYGDAVRALPEAMRLAERADLMLVVGTSLTTYPAAALPQIAREQGCRILSINDDCLAALADIVEAEQNT